MTDIVKMVIELVNGTDLAKVTRKFTDNSEDIKWISLLDMVRILEDSTVGESYMEIGELPFGYVRGAKDVMDPSTFLIVLKYPAEKRILTYYDEEMLVPFPELLFEFMVTKGKIMMSNVFAIIHEQGKDFLANYPFGNVHAGGAVCWGRNVLPVINNMKEIELVIGLFFGSITNNDLYTVGMNVKKTKGFVNQKGLLLALEGKVTFPQKWLVKWMDRTVSDEITCFFEQNMK